MGADRFRLRRVLLGVVMGLVLVTLAFYGWIQYRQSQYAQRERDLLSRYHDDYTTCLAAGNGSLACARNGLAACVNDPFWRGDEPFATAGSTPADPNARCRAEAITS
jgi:hypothetical protein